MADRFTDVRSEGTEWTRAGRLATSANDPKQTLGRVPPAGPGCAILSVESKRGIGRETARFHQAACWRRGVATRGARAAAKPLSPGFGQIDPVEN